MHSGFRGSISGIRVDFGQIVLMERSSALNNTLRERERGEELGMAHFNLFSPKDFTLDWK